MWRKFVEYIPRILFCHMDRNGRYNLIENGEIYSDDVNVAVWIDAYLYSIHWTSIKLIHPESMNIDSKGNQHSYCIIPKVVIEQLIENIISRNFEICETGFLMLEIEDGQKKLTESGEELVRVSEKLKWMLARATDEDVFIVRS